VCSEANAWSKGTSQFDVAELKLIQWRRSIETRAHRAITVQLDVYCSCFSARLPRAAGSPSGPVMRQLLDPWAVYPSGMLRHQSRARRRYYPAENEGHFLAGSRTAQRIFFVMREYEPEKRAPMRSPMACLVGAPQGVPEVSFASGCSGIGACPIRLSGPHICRPHSGCGGRPGFLYAWTRPGSILWLLLGVFRDARRARARRVRARAPGARAHAGCARARRGTVAAAAGCLLPAATGQLVGGGGCWHRRGRHRDPLPRTGRLLAPLALV